jgi:hypothetical protein
MSNDKKKLLNESTVRRFMGLAGIGALSNEFVNQAGLREQNLPDDVDKPQGTPPEKGTESPFKDKQPPPPADDGTNKYTDRPSDIVEQEEMAGMPVPDEAGVEGEAGLEGEEEPVQDIDLTPDEAAVLVDLGRRLAGEMPEEEPGMEAPPEEIGMGAPPEEMPMQEALIHKLTSRVANRIKKEHVVNEVMKRVARRLQKK